MARSPARAKRVRGDGAATELAILEAAIPFFARDGYELVSLRSIAEAVGVTAPTIYLYFKDKQSLYTAAYVHCHARSTKAILAAANKGGTPQARLRNFIEGMAAALIEHPDNARLFQRELVKDNSEILAMTEHVAFREPFELLTELIHECTGEPRSPREAMSYFAFMLGLLLMSQLMELAGDDEVSLAHDPAALADMVLRKLGPPGV